MLQVTYIIKFLVKYAYVFNIVECWDVRVLLILMNGRQTPAPASGPSVRPASSPTRSIIMEAWILFSNSLIKVVRDQVDYSEMSR